MNVTHPSLAFAFNPIMIDITDCQYSSVELFIYEKQSDGSTLCGRLTRPVVKNRVSFDIQAVVQGCFDRRQFHLIKELGDDVLHKRIFVVVGANEQSHWTCDINAIWGAMQIGQTWSQSKTLPCFRHMPYSVPLWLDTPKTVYASVDGGPYGPYVTLPAGKHNLAADFDAQHSVMLRIPGDTGADTGIFDYTFDYTFRPVERDAIYIRLIPNPCTEGVYLRWINKLGEWCYYLFEERTSSREVKTADANIPEYLTGTDYVSRYHIGSNHYQSRQVQHSVRLAAPLVDLNTREMLHSLPESPVVDLMRKGSDGSTNWLGVNIAGGTFTLGDDPLADFECTLQMPQTYTQSL